MSSVMLVHRQCPCFYYRYCLTSCRGLCLFLLLLAYMIYTPGMTAVSRCKLTAKEKDSAENYSAKYFKYMEAPFNRLPLYANVTVKANKFRRQQYGFFVSEFNKLKPGRRRRIAGGRVADNTDFPWTVAFQDIFGDPTCTGSLINHDWIVTAAHCVLDSIIDVSIWRINASRHRVEKTIKHPEYVYPGPYADVALVKLNMSVCMSDGLLPICLPLDDLDREERIAKCTVTGFGPDRPLSFGSHQSLYMKSLAVNVLSDSMCMFYQRLTQSRQGHFAVSSYTYCIVPNNTNAGMCAGDSGGPLNCKVREKYFLEGITSLSLDTCKSDIAPAFCTATEHFINWILSNVDFEKSTNPRCP